MPSIITCIVAKKLSSDPQDPHWSLRDFAALLVSHICITYGSSYPTMQPRVTKTLLRAFLDPMKSYATNYGAVRGLSALGNQAIKLLILPNLPVFQEHLKLGLELDVEKVMADDSLNKDQQTAFITKKFEAQKCLEAIKVSFNDFYLNNSTFYNVSGKILKIQSKLLVKTLEFFRHE